MFFIWYESSPPNKLKATIGKGLQEEKQLNAMSHDLMLPLLL